jgi:hypothetical protein
MMLEVTERPREREMLLRREVLLPEEQHLPFEERVAYLVAQDIVERHREIDIAHFGANHFRAGLDLDARVRTRPPLVRQSAHHSRTDAPGHRPGQA